MEKQTQKKNWKPFLILGLALVVLAATGAFFWIKSAAYESTDDAQLDGNIYSVRSGITAYLDTIYFQDNQLVKQGDTLFVFDTTALAATVQQAKAALANAKAGLSISDINALESVQLAKASVQTSLSEAQTIASAKARLEKAQNDVYRDEELLKVKAVTQSQYEADQALLKQARAAYEQAIHNEKSAVISSAGHQSQAKAAQRQISAAAAVASQREAELLAVKEQLKHAYVLAPCSGIVTKRSVDEGQYVLAGQSLCAVVDRQHLWVTANFKETQLSKIKPGQQVDISIDAYPDLELKGTVLSYGGATGAKFSLIPPDNATGNFIKVTQRFPLRIKLDDFFGSDNKPTGRYNAVLFPGLSVFVKVKTN